MITIHDIAVSKNYRSGKYWDSFYETKLNVRLPGSFSDHKIMLTEEQTAKIIDQIVEFTKENLTFDHYQEREPEPVEPEVAAEPVPADEMEPL